ATGSRIAATAITLCLMVSWLLPNTTFNAIGLAQQARGARHSMRIDVAEAITSAGIDHAVVFLREPLSARLTRRLWGIGASPSATAQLVATREPCALLASLIKAESDTARPRSFVVPMAMKGAASAVPGEHCATEHAADSLAGFVPFGVALPLVSF